MASFIIEGGHRLNGDLIPQGAKNEALEVLCATLLTPEEVKIYNIPDILDVNNLIQLLRDLGVTVKRIGLNAYSFKADKINLDYLDSDEFFQKGASLRGSVMIIGPLVARFGYAVLPKPGGDKIGRRRLDTHFSVSKSWELHLIIVPKPSVMKLKPINCGVVTCCSMKHRLQVRQIF